MSYNLSATQCSFAHFLTGCSLLLITALNSGVNKTCWQHVTACDIKAVYIKTWFMCGSQGSSIRLLQVHSSALPCLWAASEASCLQEGHWLLWMQGSECEPDERNLHTLMRTHSLFLVFITQESGKCVCVCVCVKEGERETIWVGVCVAHMSSVCVCERQVLGWGGGISTAATSSDSDVTVRLGLFRQCG